LARDFGKSLMNPQGWRKEVKLGCELTR
jgi:hypothetical protein